MLKVNQRYTDGRKTYDSNTALALRASRGKSRATHIANGKFAPNFVHFLRKISRSPLLAEPHFNTVLFLLVFFYFCVLPEWRINIYLINCSRICHKI